MVAPLGRRLGELWAEAVRTIEHTRTCRDRQEALLFAVDAYSGAPPVKLCSCDWLTRLQRDFEVRILTMLGGQFGEEAVHALAMEPSYKQRILELEAELAVVHARALT